VVRKERFELSWTNPTGFEAVAYTIPPLTHVLPGTIRTLHCHYSGHEPFSIQSGGYIGAETQIRTEA
jgi:hypothetical protein